MTGYAVHVGKGRFLYNLAALAIGVVLFAGAFPNLLFAEGLPFLAWIAYIPVFWLISRVTVRASIFWGALYGIAAYSLFNYWLSVFHPLAGFIVGSIFLFYFAILFPLLKLAVIAFPKWGYILQWLLWMGFEYVHTLGFLGYPYGIIGYSQWSFLPLIQIASIFGVWGVSALVVFPQAWIAAFLSDFKGKNFKHIQKIPICVWFACLCAALVFGIVERFDYTGAETVRISLIQHNTDPWRGGIVQYRRNFETLRRLSDEALQAKPDLVVWSETAFVPRIYWHRTYRDDNASWLLVKDLLDYFSGQNVPFLIGNDDGRREPDKNPSVREKHRVDYNAAILFEGASIAAQYRKLHLVPFTEHFPYRRQLPLIYDALKNADTHFWEKGNEHTVFDIALQNGGSLKFSAPICFEDTFGYLSRDFVRAGAELIVNITNDAWSNSLSAQMQHLNMAVFRAVETRRALVRATASGQTCAIAPDGAILAMASPFAETELTVDAPIMRGVSFYVRAGDFLPLLFLAAVAVFTLVGIIQFFLKLKKR